MFRFSPLRFSITGKSRVMFDVTTSEAADCACYPRPKRSPSKEKPSVDRIKKRFSCDDFIQFRRRARAMWTRFLTLPKWLNLDDELLKIDVIERFFSPSLVLIIIWLSSTDNSQGDKVDPVDAPRKIICNLNLFLLSRADYKVVDCTGDTIERTEARKEAGNIK